MKIASGVGVPVARERVRAIYIHASEEAGDRPQVKGLERLGMQWDQVLHFALAKLSREKLKNRGQTLTGLWGPR